MSTSAARRRVIEIRPQPGPQEAFLSTPADIAIFGGSAGGGKSYGLLLEALRHVKNPQFGAVIFRRTSPQIRNKGGLWDTSMEFYPLIGATPKETTLDWVFPGGATVSFRHMEYEKNVYDWQGSQVPYFGLDELSHFTEKQFFYLLSRNRSTSGVDPYIRATTNPEPDSWLRKFIDWWIGKDGLAIQERSGILRWMLRSGDEILWYDSRKHALEARAGLGLPSEVQPKSVTFIRSSVYDNKILLEKDPGYLANLYALPLVDREQLLGGNWNIRPSAGTLFRKEWFEVVDAAPGHAKRVRYWDRAATEPSSTNPDPDWTVGTRVAYAGGVFYVEDVVRFRGTPGKVKPAIRNTATADGIEVQVGIEVDPGQAGKAEALDHITNLAMFDAHAYPATKAKIVRAKPASGQAEVGNVKLVRGDWNEGFLNELQAFPDGAHDDQVDTLSGAVNVLSGGTVPMEIEGATKYDLDVLTQH